MEEINYAQTNELQNWNNILPSLAYYGVRNDIGVCYISDLHLMHHLQFYPSKEKMVRSIADKLINSINFDPICKTKIILFCGDTCSDYELLCQFYRAFTLRMKYEAYKIFKRKNALYFETTRDEIYSGQVAAICKLQNKIKRTQEQLSKYLDCSSLLARYSYLFELKNYLASSHYAKKNLPEWVKSNLIGLFLQNQTLERKQQLLEKIEHYKDDNSILKTINFDSSLYRNAQYTTFVILGNHEYISFENVQSAVVAYKEALSPLGIHVLHNDSVYNDHVLVFGGTGFAKYNTMWNAENIVCCPGFTREDELLEGGLFEKEYHSAISFARERKLSFICAVHYPTTDCLRNTDCDAVYFTGHNHRNEYIKSPEKTLFADNQIGYKNNDIFFKAAAWGVDINPYNSLGDGLHETNVDEYDKFYRYIGEYIGTGALIRKRSENCKMYVIKSHGFYGFFIVNDKKGISILNGGTTKRITTATNIEWIVENFNAVIEKYLHALAPLRNRQEFLSRQLKKCGFDGRIHGCIVDVDYYNHIGVNPATGELSFYYSPFVGAMHTYSSFPEMLSGMVRMGRLPEGKRLEIESSVTSAIPLLENGNPSPSAEIGSDETNFPAMQKVSLSDGFYADSRFVSSLQRLFTKRVLRRFDIALAETNNADMPTRKYQYIGRLVCYKDTCYIITVDDGQDTLELVSIGKIADCINGIYKITQKKSSKSQSINISLLGMKAEIQKPRNFYSYWITHTEKQTKEKYPGIYKKYEHLIHRI